MADQLSAVTQRNHAMRRLVAAVLINIAMGAIYAWGVFLLPLQGYLEISRAQLSSVPTVALICFTAGMVWHDRLLQALGGMNLSVVAFALAGGGFFLFAAMPCYWSLLVGYGGLFGVGSGLGYGLALALVSTFSPQKRPLAIGVAMAAFASSGILMPFALANRVEPGNVAFVFGCLAMAILATGISATALLGEGHANRSGSEISRKSPAPAIASDCTFLKLALIFLCICLVGLMTVSQLAGILSSLGMNGIVGYGLSILTSGYLAGSLFGGQAVRRLGGRHALLVANAMTAAGLAFLYVGTPSFGMLGAACVGAAFGSSASLMPTLVGELYGAEKIGEIYGRLIVSYGIAGLVAPWGSGVLYDAFGGYRIAILVGMAACAVSAVLALNLKTSR